MTSTLLRQARGAPVQNQSLEEWLDCQLQMILGFSEVQDIRDMLLLMEKEDLVMYCEGLMPDQPGKAAKLASSISSRRAAAAEKQRARMEAIHPERLKAQEVPEDAGVKVYRKEDDDLEAFGLVGGKAKTAKKKKKKGGRQERRTAGVGEDPNFEPAYCECGGTEHPLVRNCLVCGKIICEKEGWGPCLFCDGTTLTLQGEDGSYRRALEHKNKLLHFDRMGVARTQVYDDQVDFFESSDKWKSPEEREKLRAEENARQRAEAEAKGKVRITLDIGGGSIVDEAKRDEELMEHAAAAQIYQTVRPDVAQELFRNPYLSSTAPRYIPTRTDAEKEGSSGSKEKRGDTGKVEKEKKVKATKVDAKGITAKRIQHNRDEDQTFVWL